MVVDTVKPGNLFIPFHYGTHKEAANLHTGYSRDPVSQQPHQKNSRVQLSKLASGQAEPWLTKRREELIKPTIPYAAMEIGGTVNLEAPTMTTPFSKERRTMRKRSTTRAPTKR
jgi:predicted molibdopterin-dependent oxidoreductase YjgC